MFATKKVKQPKRKPDIEALQNGLNSLIAAIQIVCTYEQQCAIEEAAFNIEGIQKRKHLRIVEQCTIQK